MAAHCSLQIHIKNREGKIKTKYCPGNERNTEQQESLQTFVYFHVNFACAECKDKENYDVSVSPLINISEKSFKCPYSAPDLNGTGGEMRHRIRSVKLAHKS